MDRRTRNAFAIVLVLVIAVTGGAALILGGGGSAGPIGTPPADATVVDGVVVGVDAASLTDVRSFDLRTVDGRVLTFGLAELENGTAFPPGHLNEHQARATPVRVWYREGDPLQALWLEDAPTS